MSRIRTFIAVETPASIRQQAASIIQSLSACTDSIKWVAPSKIHVTVKFLGDVEDTDVYQVCRTTADAVVDTEPFQAPCRGVGAFPHLDRPRTVWLGIDDPDGQFEALHGRIDAALGQLNFPEDARRFRPHLTLGRLRYGRRDLGDLVPRLQEKADMTLGRLDVAELIIFASELTSEGPAYSVMGRAPLGGAVA